MTNSLLYSAPDDIQRADEVRALVKDIWDLRLAKLRKSIDLMVTQQETFGKVRTTPGKIKMRTPFLNRMVCNDLISLCVVIDILSPPPPQLDNLTLMEINTVRPFLTQALDHTHFLRSHAQLHASDQISDSAAF